jgi:hypothetical protein
LVGSAKKDAVAWLEFAVEDKGGEGWGGGGCDFEPAAVLRFNVDWQFAGAFEVVRTASESAAGNKSAKCDGQKRCQQVL